MAEGRLVIGTRRYSSWSLRGWLAVRLAELDVEEVVIPLADGATPALTAATPTGLVPYLEHRGARVWDSLAICEYCAEFAPLWPGERVARAAARSIAAEMHSGFRALRMAMPMVTERAEAAGRGRTAECLADIARIEQVWGEVRAAHGREGPYLFGAAFGAADAMFAPVVVRLLTYRPELSAAARDYCAAVRAHPLVAEWYRLAAAEPMAWRLAKYETI